MAHDDEGTSGPEHSKADVQAGGRPTNDEVRDAVPAQYFVRGPLEVLIAEDVPEIAEMVALAVKFAGYFPVIAANGRQALDLTRAHQPALIITDLVMPEVDGADLIRAVQAEADLAGRTAPPIVLMTAVKPESLPDTGADVVLFKPFTVTALHQVLERFLGSPGAPPSTG